MNGITNNLKGDILMKEQTASSTYFGDLFSYQAPFLEKKLIELGVFPTTEEYQVAFEEFKKFAMISSESSEAVGMLSKKVDEIWHQFILFTPDYFSFCEKYIGRYLHHLPTIEGEEEIEKKAASAFLKKYNDKFGELHPIWLESKMSGTDCWTTPGCRSITSDCWTTPGCRSAR